MKRNYKYAKLDGDKLVYAPNKLIIGSEQVFNASEETYKTQGYYPIIKTEPPQTTEEYYYIAYYVMENDTIKQQWQAVEIPKYDVEYAEGG